MNGNHLLNYALSFLLGAIMGAAVSLLLAPSSGEELRSNIKTQADAQVARLQDDYQKGMQEIHNRLDRINSELQSMSSRSK